MKPTDQIAAEAWDEIYNANANRPQGISIIKSAIEKAYQAGVDHMAEWNKDNSPSTAHASEQDCVQLLREAHERLGNTAFPALAARIAKFLSQRPTPTTASETFGPNKTEAPWRKPDSASTGKDDHESESYLAQLNKQTGEEIAATPSGGGEWTPQTVADIINSIPTKVGGANIHEAISAAHNAALQSRDPYKCEKCGKALGWCEPCICDECKTKEGK